MQLWGYPTSPNGVDESFGETEPVEVTADYDETMTSHITTEDFVKYVVVFTRNAGSAVYRQTARFDFPAP